MTRLLALAVGTALFLAAPLGGKTREPSATLIAAGDVASCTSTGDEATAALLDRLSGVVAVLGDSVYERGTSDEYARCYEPTWGRHRARTRPAVGNHEYGTPGATGYFRYFGRRAGPPHGYYAYDLGAWRALVLNTNCGPAGGCRHGSPQERWLRAELAPPRRSSLRRRHRRAEPLPRSSRPSGQPFRRRRHARAARPRAASRGVQLALRGGHGARFRDEGSGRCHA